MKYRQGRIQEFLKGGGGLYTIVVTFNADGVEGEWWRELLRGKEPCSFPPPTSPQKKKTSDFSL